MQKNCFKIAILLGVVYFYTFASEFVFAVPGYINFQGRLLDANKNPKSGSFDMVFGIWDTGPGTGGSQLWTETRTGIQVTNGMFSVQLGAVTPITNTVFSADNTWLQIRVGEETLTPRERLVTTPYSFRAVIADNAVSTDTTQSISGQKTFTPTTIFSSATFSGNIGIGTTAPAKKLDVVGEIKTSTSTTSTVSINIAGAVDNLPASGYSEGTFIYQTSNHKVYVSTTAVNNVDCWKPLW